MDSIGQEKNVCVGLRKYGWAIWPFRHTGGKAGELLKLIGTQKSVVCSESCKAVVCLELACTLIGTEIISRENAIKYSGCKKSVYVNMFNIISKILNYDRVYSVKEVCLTLGVSEVETLSVKLMDKYQTTEFKTKEEMEHPMYPCAAVMASCKCNNIKFNTSKLVELSRLKKGELEELTSAFVKLKESLDTGKRAIKPAEIEKSSVNDVETPKKVKKKTQDDAETEYQEWKKRMLAE